MPREFIPLFPLYLYFHLELPSETEDLGVDQAVQIIKYFIKNQKEDRINTVYDKQHKSTKEKSRYLQKTELFPEKHFPAP